jgi:hypothetical protein
MDDKTRIAVLESEVTARSAAAEEHRREIKYLRASLRDQHTLVHAIRHMFNISCKCCRKRMIEELYEGRRK